MGKLSQKKIRELTEPGRYGDGDGLYLHIREGGSRQWVLRCQQNGKRHDIGLGSAELLSLVDARGKAFEIRRDLRSGKDPLGQRTLEKGKPTFSQSAQIVWRQENPNWRNPKHSAQWIRTLETYAFPHFGEKRIDTISTADVLNALAPIWNEKRETSERLLQRISKVFDWAKAAGHRADENPTHSVRSGLPKRDRQRRHQPALTWKTLPVFMEDLGRRNGIASMALAFLILTATRSGEARGARWQEIDLTEGVWTIPAARMKMKKPHRVPLSRQAVSIIKQCARLNNEFVFPSDTGSKLSENAFRMLLHRMEHKEITTHGFRATFRDWTSEKAVPAPRELAEVALSHKVGDATEQAYARSDMLERRRALMQEWADFAHSTETKASD